MRSEQNGINLWRQIGETLAEEIGNGEFAAGERLPPATNLAERFGVNPHTVLRAISHLQDEGLVRIERGRGTFVAETIPYRMGRKTRFEENLSELNQTPSRELVSVGEVPASKTVAGALGVREGDSVVLAVLVAIADGVPISFNRNHFPKRRFAAISEIYRREAAVEPLDLATSRILGLVGVADFQRKQIRIRGREATSEETRHLRMSPNDSVFEVDVTNVDQAGEPIVFGQTSFCMSRIEFVWDFDEAGK